MKALCERFGVSRETGYVWLRRYRQNGPEGLLEVNRVPNGLPWRGGRRGRKQSQAG